MTLLMAKRMQVNKMFRPLELTAFPLQGGGTVELDENDRVCLTEKADGKLTLEVFGGRHKGKVIQIPEDDSKLLTTVK